MKRVALALIFLLSSSSMLAMQKVAKCAVKVAEVTAVVGVGACAVVYYLKVLKERKAQALAQGNDLGLEVVQADGDEEENAE